MTQQHADALAEEFRQKFDAYVEAEEVASGRFRFTVVSPQFVNMAHLRRQDALWEVVDAVLPREVRLDITLVIAYAPDEIELESAT